MKRFGWAKRLERSRKSMKYVFFLYKISLLKKKERKKRLEMTRLVENVLGYKLVRR